MKDAPVILIVEVVSYSKFIPLFCLSISTRYILDNDSV